MPLPKTSSYSSESSYLFVPPSVPRSPISAPCLFALCASAAPRGKKNYLCKADRHVFDPVFIGEALGQQFKVFDGQLGVAHWVNRSRTRSATAALQSPLMAQFFPPLTALSFQLQALLLAFKTVIPTTSSSSSVRISTSSPISTVFFALCGFRKLK
jgi:hypothetical protein